MGGGESETERVEVPGYRVRDDDPCVARVQHFDSQVEVDGEHIAHLVLAQLVLEDDGARVGVVDKRWGALVGMGLSRRDRNQGLGVGDDLGGHRSCRRRDGERPEMGLGEYNRVLGADRECSEHHDARRIAVSSLPFGQHNLFSRILEDSRRRRQ